MKLDDHEPIEDEQIEEQAEKVSQRGIYLLPNLLTTAALFAGFYSIVAAMKGYFEAAAIIKGYLPNPVIAKGYFETAAIAIFVAMIADGLDGRVARLTNTQSPFGAQYDSLADMVAFGLAPALLIYSWSLFELGKVGWLAAFLYTAAVALRLARFNTRVSDKWYFQGLPSPSAAGILASLVWMGSSYGIKGTAPGSYPLAAFTILVAILMVSSIRYSSFKSIDFKGKVPFFTVVTAVFVITAIALEPPEMLFALFLCYVVSGPILTLWQLRKIRKQRMWDAKNKNNG